VSEVPVEHWSWQGVRDPVGQSLLSRLAPGAGIAGFLVADITEPRRGNRAEPSADDDECPGE